MQRQTSLSTVSTSVSCKRFTNQCDGEILFKFLYFFSQLSYSKINLCLYSSYFCSLFLKGLLRDEIEEEAVKAFRFYLGIVASPANGTDDFAMKVNEYMQLPPFNFPNPISSFGGIKKVTY